MEASEETEQMMDAFAPLPDLGTRLRQARQHAGMTQAAVAAQLGMARTTLVAIEQNRRALRASELHQLAVCYGCSPEQLLTGSLAEGSPQAARVQERVVTRLLRHKHQAVIARLLTRKPTGVLPLLVSQLSWQEQEDLAAVLLHQLVAHEEARHPDG